MAHVVIVGSGVVGTATGKGFARHGHRVSFVDIDPRRIDALRSEGFGATDHVRLPSEPSIVFLTLPTPNDGHRWDLGPFRRGAEQVAEAMKDSHALHTVVVRSTVPPGTTDGLVRPILEEATGGRQGERFSLAANPEFLRAACALEDFLNPWMTVVASRSKRTLERMRRLFEPFGGEIHTFGDPRVAELVKCAHNLFNATKISFWNEIWRVGNRLGMDVADVARIVSRSAEGSYNPEYGINAGAPYGGACLPKDTKGFLGFARHVGVEMPLLQAVDEVNEQVAADGQGITPDRHEAADGPTTVPSAPPVAGTIEPDADPSADGQAVRRAS
ncbi:MAG TPA: nucleotide sugar dehydrogenase [Actinomycetota bacterium]|jgi:UDPglucose 6-dehydrogenase|nr:nucleotide sugar dehydrogenase [Actinomycetota bacterium]